MGNRKTTISNFKLAGVAAAMMMGSADLSALGLGALEVQSNLDQPLKGFIELRVAPGDDVRSIKAVIASRDDFDSLGIEYPEYLRDISLDVEDVSGATVLYVNSKDVIIKEPFIHFLVKVDWSGGSFLREYTALIDPPVYAAESPKVLSEPVAVGTDQSYQSDSFDDISGEDLNETPTQDIVSEDSFTVEEDLYEPEAVTSNSPSQTGTISSAPATDAQYGPVVRGESLSVIAQQLQSQFPDLSIYQIMQVLFEENRGSFINENINGLVRGAILNIGNLDAIRAVDVEQSKQFFRSQINEWDPSVLASKDEPLKVGQDEYDFGENEPESTDLSSSDDSAESFQVGSTSDTETFVSEGSGSSDEGEVIAMRDQINELQASLASSSLENQELTERISILEGQLTDMNRLMNLNVEDAEMASVEATLAEQNASDDLDDGSELADESDLLADGSDLLADGTDLLADGSDLLADGSDLAEGAIDSATDLFDEGTGELLADSDELLDDPLAGFGEGVDELSDGLSDGVDELSDGLGDMVDGSGLTDGSELLDEGSDLLADGSELLDDTITEPLAAATADPIAAKQSFFDKAKGMVADNGAIVGGVGALFLAGIAAIFFRRRRADEEFEISMLSIESNSQNIDDSVASVTASMSASVTHSVAQDESPDKETSFLTVYSDSDAVVQADEVDPIAEADVYIAYGRDEQAEEVLLDGISGHPGRVDIKHKLLGLYHKNKNAEGYERVAEEVYSQRESLSSEMWQDVCRMGKEVVPGNPLFDLSADDLQAAEQVDAVPASDLVDADDVSDVVQSDDLSDDAGADAPSEMIEDALDDNDNDSIQLVNFEDGRSEISELDELEIDALNSEVTVDDVSKSDDVADELEMISMNLDEAPNDKVDSDALDLPKNEDNDSEITISEVQEVSGLEIDADYDEARTQYELAKVFVDLGDEDGARKILKEIVSNNDNSDDVLTDSRALLDSIDS